MHTDSYTTTSDRSLRTTTTDAARRSYVALAVIAAAAVVTTSALSSGGLDAAAEQLPANPASIRLQKPVFGRTDEHQSSHNIAPVNLESHALVIRPRQSASQSVTVVSQGQAARPETARVFVEPQRTKQSDESGADSETEQRRNGWSIYPPGKGGTPATERKSKADWDSWSIPPIDIDKPDAASPPLPEESTDVAEDLPTSEPPSHNPSVEVAPSMTIPGLLSDDRLESHSPPLSDLPPSPGNDGPLQELSIEDSTNAPIPDTPDFDVPPSGVPDTNNQLQLPPGDDSPNSIYQGHSLNGDSILSTPPSGHSFFGNYPGTSGFRATVESDGTRWLGPYAARAGTASGRGVLPEFTSRTQLPPGFLPWWDEVVRQPVGLSQSVIPVTVESLLQDALSHSPHVQAVRIEPEIRYHMITQEAARFDWTTFLESRYNDLNDPVGNELTTGTDDDRFLRRRVNVASGFRNTNRHGGQLQISQQLGHENQNSRFFRPNSQGSARLELSYRQPLWDGAGRTYNESRIVLARIGANTAQDAVVRALQDHLIEVTQAYWNLYRARAQYQQRLRLLHSTQEVLANLESSDATPDHSRQVLRTKTAIAQAQTTIQRSVARIRDGESRLRLLVNSPDLVNSARAELTPEERPGTVTETAELTSVLQSALIHRPDISEAIRHMRAAGVRLGVSQQEILPRLDLLVETYVADLAGGSDIGRAIRGQFADNRPGYTIGLTFEVPIENRAAIARMQQQQLELRRSINVFRTTVEKALTDVEIASREVATAYSETLTRYDAMTATEEETRFLRQLFEKPPTKSPADARRLNDLLDAFERLADQEAAFVDAQVDHAMALVSLKKEIGILLKSQHGRPAVDVAQQTWMNERIAAASRTLPDQAAQNSATDLIRPTGFRSDSDADERAMRPIPASPTTWSRPGRRVGGYSLDADIGGR